MPLRTREVSGEYGERLHLTDPALMTDGQERTDRNGAQLLLRATPFLAADQSVLGWIVSLTDISSIRRAQEEREEAVRFLTHDIRSPQASIIALVELRRQRHLSLSEPELLDRIERHAQETMALADGFVQLARAKSIDLQIDLLDLRSLLIDAADDLWALASAKDVVVDIEGGDEDIFIQGDRSLIMRAMVNLLNNAIKYSPNGGTVHMALCIENTDVAVRVIDHGPGIPAHEVPTIFDAFRRARNQPGKISGAGLGLAFVRVVAQRHGGDATILNATPDGTSIEIRLPMSGDISEGGDWR